MIFSIPYCYYVSGIGRGKRSTSGMSCYDTARINVREVDSRDLTHALTLLDWDGRPAETFYHFDGAFWINNSRSPGDEFAEQHMMLVGEWPRRATPNVGHNYGVYGHRPRGTPYCLTKAEAEQINTRTCQGLSMLGIFGLFTTDLGASRVLDKNFTPQHPFRLEGDVLICDTIAPETTMRIISENKQENALLRVSSYAEANIIAVAGELYHRVPEPVIYATKREVGWCFSDSIKPLSDGHGYQKDSYDISTKEAYKIPMSEFESIPDSFPELNEKNAVKFYVEHIDLSCFSKVDLSGPVIKDIKEALSRYDVLNQRTPFVHKWCELRDLVEPVEKNLESQDTDFFDRAAEILIDMDAIRRTEKYSGAKMWANREVDLTLPLAQPQP